MNLTDCHFFQVLLFSLSVILTSKSSNESVVWLWIEPIMSYTFGSLWVIPLFWLSKILNSLWFLVSLFIVACYYHYFEAGCAKVCNKFDMAYCMYFQILLGLKSLSSGFCMEAVLNFSVSI